MNYLINLSIGTLLLRPKCLGIVQHEGVVVGHDAVIHNTPAKGEHVSTLKEFAAGEPVQTRPTGADPAQVLTRTRQLLSNAKPYDLFGRNCQHTTSEVIRGIGRSPWIASGTAIVVIIAGIWIISAAMRKN